MTRGKRRGLQCSHFFSRRYLSIRFDLRNCNAQCAGCNRRHNRDRAPYERYMVETYGPGVVAELDELKRNLEKATDEQLEVMLLRYEGMA